MKIDSCSSCKWWGDDDYPPGTCIRTTWVDPPGTPQEDDLTFWARADDDQGLDAGIRTGPDFCCILHEAR